MRQARIAVVGDVMLDRYLIGDTERISPEAPVPVVTVEEERVVPGGAANVAANIAAIGAHAAPGRRDRRRRRRQRRSGRRSNALEISPAGLITVPGRPTTSKTRIIARGQQVVRIDREVTNPLPDRFRDALLAAAHAVIAGADVLLIEDYDKGTIDAAMAAELVAAGRARNIPVVVDPKRRNFFAYSGATVFKPNRRELEAAFSTHFMGDDADLEGARQRLGAEHLLLTLGRDGMILVSPGRTVASARRASRAMSLMSRAPATRLPPGSPRRSPPGQPSARLRGSPTSPLVSRSANGARRRSRRPNCSRSSIRSG